MSHMSAIYLANIAWNIRAKLKLVEFVHARLYKAIAPLPEDRLLNLIACNSSKNRS